MATRPGERASLKAGAGAEGRATGVQVVAGKGQRASPGLGQETRGGRGGAAEGRGEIVRAANRQGVRAEANRAALTAIGVDPSNQKRIAIRITRMAGVQGDT